MTPLTALLLLTGALPLDPSGARALAGRQGAVVVLDVATGNTLASYPPDVASRRAVKPGSTIKPFTLAALLAAGAVSDAPCPGTLTLAGRNLSCSHPPVAGRLGPDEALAYSCNCWFARLALRLDPRAFSASLRTSGFTVPGDPSTPEALQLLALGEGGVSITPLALARAWLKLARSAPPPLLAGLQDATTYGTARLARPAGLAVAGKTGTATSEDRTWKHGWFAGFAPAVRPRVVVVAFVERGQGGSDAAPVARHLFEAWQKRDASPAPWAVRLFWLTPPAEAVVTPSGKPPVRVSASSNPVRFDGPLTLAVPGSEPLALDFPVEIAPHDGRLRITVHIPREEYVAGVLAGESSVFRSPESMKAMAVAARTYALHFAGRHRAEGFDFCDTTHCQDLRLAARSARLRQAVDATGNQVLWFGGQPAAAYYSRHCGGLTEAGGLPYLPSHPDTWCGRADWHTELNAADLARAGLKPPVSILERSSSGRVTRIQVGPRALPIGTFLGLIGENLGWNRLRSPWFTVHSGAVFDGHGSGHGIGLCQTGAASMGESNHSYQDILAFYYPGTRLGVAAQGFAWTILAGERVDVWTTQPGSDGSVVDLAGRLLVRAEQSAGFPGPRRVRLMVYPTVAAFRDATGQPGTVAASTLGDTIRLQPLSALRARGIIESTLLHEFVHTTLETRTRPDVPDWLREGLAALLSGGAVPPRVAALVQRYGRRTVLTWLQTGVPPAATLMR